MVGMRWKWAVDAAPAFRCSCESSAQNTFRASTSILGRWFARNGGLAAGMRDALIFALHL